MVVLSAPSIVWAPLKMEIEGTKQYIRYRRTLTQAHLPRPAVFCQPKVCTPTDLAVNIPVAICVAASDTLHTGDDFYSIADSLPYREVVSSE